MKLDYKGGNVTWNLYDSIDWTKLVTHATEGFLSEDILTIEYEHCLIDLGWYGGSSGRFCIKVIVPFYSKDPNVKYDAEDWMYPIANIPCENQYDMQIQLQRAIDVYPELSKNYGKKHL